MQRALFLLLLATGLFSSCSPQLSVFDRKLYEQQNWSDDELKRIQFYLSEDLTIYRYLDEDETALAPHQRATLEFGIAYERAVLHWFERCGHFPQWDAPEEATRLILDSTG